MKTVMCTSQQEVAQAIRDRIEETGRFQVTVASDLNITPKHMNQMLQGNAGISIDMMLRVSDLLDIAFVIGAE